MEHLWLFIILALIAEILGTIGGFGSSLFFVPIAGLFLDLHSVLGITALFHVSSNLTKITLFHHGIDRKILWQMGIPAVVFVVAGAWLSQFMDAVVIEICLAVFLITLSGFFLLFSSVQLKPSARNAISGGVLSGFAAGLMGTGGAIRGLVMAAFKLRIEVFIATSALIDLLIDASRAVVYSANGFVHRHDLFLIPILLVVSIAGTYLGKLILQRISEERFRTLVLGLVFLTGASVLVKMLLR